MRRQTPKAKAVRRAAARPRKRAAKTGAQIAAFPAEPRKTTSGLLSGDLQGLSNIESAQSESVDELLEEGNSFEADVVAGVQDADSHDEREVHTHEVPEDDVPEEYLEKD